MGYSVCATLAVARRMEADEAVNTMADPEGLAPWRVGKGRVDLVFECSAAAPAIRDAVDGLRPLGTLVQVGVAGPTPVPINVMVGKEIQVVGSQRFDVEFADAVALIGSRAIDPAPIITPPIPWPRRLTPFARPATGHARSRCNFLSPTRDARPSDENPSHQTDLALVRPEGSGFPSVTCCKRGWRASSPRCTTCPPAPCGRPRRSPDGRPNGPS